MGNRLAVQNDGVTETYLPNDGTRLTDPMNRYQQVDADAFTYDPKGNLTADGRNTYTYDDENRQTGMTGPGGAAEYVYDPRAAAWRRSWAAWRPTTSTTPPTRSSRSGTVSGSMLARYTYGDYIDEPLTMERGGATYTYHRDALGSVTEVTTAAGTLVERYEYDVFGLASIFNGENSQLDVSGIENLWLFTGRQLDVESGNYYFRSRSYAPRIGRYAQTDPLGYVDGMSLYAGYFVPNGLHSLRAVQSQKMLAGLGKGFSSGHRSLETLHGTS